MVGNSVESVVEVLQTAEAVEKRACAAESLKNVDQARILFKSVDILLTTAIRKLERMKEINEAAIRDNKSQELD